MARSNFFSRLFLSISIIILSLDQIVKYIIDKSMSLGQSIPLIPNILHLTYIHNTGAGFGILRDMNSLLIWISLIIIGAILYNYDKIPKENIPQAATALIIGGAAGNLISRIFQGYVIDFIDFRVWPSFNVADSAITIGAIILVIYLWKK
ncbi:MAG: signal peptidase II [Nanoarchaeota archaeon]